MSLWIPEDTHLGPPRRILVCGSRGWTDEPIIRARLEQFVPQDPQASEPTIVHGDAGKWNRVARRWEGADKIAGAVALDLGLWVEAHPVTYKRRGRSAPHVRNARMLDSGVDLVVAFQLDNTPGTVATVAGARTRGIRVEVIHRCGASCHQVGGDAGCIYLSRSVTVGHGEAA